MVSGFQASLQFLGSLFKLFSKHLLSVYEALCGVLGAQRTRKSRFRCVHLFCLFYELIFYCGKAEHK